MLAAARPGVLLLVALLRGTPSQAGLDVDQLLAERPGCFFKGFQYTPAIPGTQRTVADLLGCQSLCANLAGCAVFAFFPSTGACHFGDRFAQMVQSHSGAVAGFGVCPAPTAQPPAACQTELPQNGFPGVSPNATNAAWPSGRQPWSLECWPKNWTGGYIPCRQVAVLEDTRRGWPGKCQGLARQAEVDGSCDQDCSQNPLCPVWQTSSDGGCWQGAGLNCYVRKDFAPVQAGRLQHGMVRVLMDLAGWQIAGLYRSFENGAGYFEEQADAIAACKTACYSDIQCQFWQYAPKYGCFVEDAARKFRPPYPLTLDWAFRSTAFALDCVAGEYVQHYCPDSLTTAYPSAAEEPPLASCMTQGIRYDPPDMMLQSRTAEASADACQARCKGTVGCAHFAYWPDGGCHLQDSVAGSVPAEDYKVVSGPPECPSSYSPSPAVSTNWMTQEGHEALSGGSGGPDGSSQGGGLAAPESGPSPAQEEGVAPVAVIQGPPLAGPLGASKAAPPAGVAAGASDGSGIWSLLLLLAFGLLVSVGAVAAGVAFCRKPSPAKGGRRPRRSDYQPAPPEDSFNGSGSENSDEGDEAVWASEPSWNAPLASASAAASQGERGPLVRSSGLGRRGEFTV